MQVGLSLNNEADMPNNTEGTSSPVEKIDSAAVPLAPHGGRDTTASKKGKEKKLERKWVNQDIKGGPPRTWSYDDEVVNMLVEFTKLYAHTRGDVSFDITYHFTSYRIQSTTQIQNVLGN